MERDEPSHSWITCFRLTALIRQNRSSLYESKQTITSLTVKRNSTRVISLLTFHLQTGPHPVICLSAIKTIKSTNTVQLVHSLLYLFNKEVRIPLWSHQCFKVWKNVQLYPPCPEVTEFCETVSCIMLEMALSLIISFWHFASLHLSQAIQISSRPISGPIFVQS